jgi:hypothetical protein
MKFTVQVTRENTDPESEDFEGDADKLDELSDKANKAYIKAVSKYDVSHVIALYRDGAMMTNDKGTGTGSLKVDKGEPVAVDSSTQPGQSASGPESKP